MTNSEMRSQAPRANAENRAEVVRKKTSHTIARAEPEAAAFYLARRFGLARPLAHAIATPAPLGRAFG